MLSASSRIAREVCCIVCNERIDYGHSAEEANKVNGTVCVCVPMKSQAVRMRQREEGWVMSPMQRENTLAPEGGATIVAEISTSNGTKDCTGVRRKSRRDSEGILDWPVERSDNVMFFLSVHICFCEAEFWLSGTLPRN